MNEKDKRKYYKSYISLYNRLVSEFTPKVAEAIRGQVKVFTHAYAQHSHVTPDIISGLPIKKALKRLYIVSGLTNATKVYRSIKGQMKGVKRDDTWTWVIGEYLKTHGLDKVSIDIADTLKDKIKAEIIKGHEQGWGVDKIVKHINDADFPDWMAKRIVRTELNKASNIGAMVAAADLNIEVQKEWLSTQDNRTRRIPRDQYDHLDMNGVKVGFNDRFIVPSTKTVDAMLHPGDPDASVGNIVNCRCTLVFVPVRTTEGLTVSNDKGPELVSEGAEPKTTNIFIRLLKEAAQIEITQYIINHILNSDD